MNYIKTLTLCTYVILPYVPMVRHEACVKYKLPKRMKNLHSPICRSD